MNTHLILAAVSAPAERLSERLATMLWQAYGGPIKIVCCIALVVFVAAPLVMFIRKLCR